MRKTFSFLLSADSFLGKIIIALVYIYVYDYLFDAFIFQSFSYLGGIDYIPMNAMHRTLWIVFSLLPMCFYHGIKKISSFFSLFLYIFVYIPIVHAMSVIWNVPNIDVFSVNGILCLLFCIYFAIDKKVKIIKNFRIVPSIPYKCIVVVTILLTLIFVALQFKKMHFVNPISQQDLLYDFRAQNSEEGSGFINYIAGWLFGAFYPFLLVSFLKKKEWFKSSLILGGYVLLFMVDMQKLTFFMPLFLAGMYFLIKANIDSISKCLHSYIMIPLCISGLILLGLQNNKILFIIASFVILRTICVSGWLTQMYVHFFQIHKFTYYSHISIVNFFTHSYPYDVGLGQIVAYNTQNANATFFLTDGYAAYGVVGIIIIGLFFLLFLSIINAISYRYKVSDLMIIFLPCLSYLLNTSIFTTLLSNGMFITMLLLCSTEKQQMK